MKRFLATLVALASASLLLLPLCGCGSNLSRYEAVYTDLFDTDCTFTAYCSSDEEFETVSEAVYNELSRLDSLFDIYDGGEGSLKDLNDNKTLENASDDILELLDIGVLFYDLSGGKLNIAMGSVLSLWHDARETGILPDDSELTEASLHCDIANLEIDGSTVTISDPEMTIDVGSIAKGYAADKAAEIAGSYGLTSFALDLGGNVKTVGEKPTGKWVIGIQDPDGGILKTVEVADQSVVTSGDYERYTVIDGVSYSHIIDPDTLYPADNYRSVTVICESSSLGDALSTSLFCMSVEDGKALAEEFGVEVLWVYEDGAVESNA
ncbi:MAG: FAD:protein FMN transferase [Oscillospiraceae bacterium]|nr:FAD:protein FMN transferase [Oscillospiraceae bacterium]